MPQPTFSGTPPHCTFGGIPLPNGQGTSPSINLNDQVSWYWQDITLGSLMRQVGTAHRTWVSSDVFQSLDRTAWKLVLPTRYKEGVASLGAAIATLTQVGPQYLSFDNGTTLGLCLFSDRSNVKLVQRWTPYIWNLSLEFIILDYWQDAAFTTAGPTTTPGSTGGTATTFNVTYAGSVWVGPSYVSGNNKGIVVKTNSAATITALEVQNTMSGEFLTVNSGQLVANAPTEIDIDCTGWTVVDSSSNQYDVSGSFPRLYGPVGQVNPIKVTLSTSAAAAGATTTLNYYNRWELA